METFKAIVYIIFMLPVFIVRLIRAIFEIEEKKKVVVRYESGVEKVFYSRDSVRNIHTGYFHGFQEGVTEMPITFTIYDREGNEY